MIKDYELILTSYPDCEDFVVEIWLKNNLIAIVTENNDIQYADRVDESIVEGEEFACALSKAKEKLGIDI